MLPLGPHPFSPPASRPCSRRARSRNSHALALSASCRRWARARAHGHRRGGGRCGLGCGRRVGLRSGWCAVDGAGTRQKQGKLLYGSSSEGTLDLAATGRVTSMHGSRQHGRSLRHGQRPCPACVQWRARTTPSSASSSPTSATKRQPCPHSRAPWILPPPTPATRSLSLAPPFHNAVCAFVSPV
jgi:hypothetical protein